MKIPLMTDTLNASDSLIGEIFGFNAPIAKKLIDNKKRMIELGYETDWSERREQSRIRSISMMQETYIELHIKTSKIFEMTEREIANLNMCNASIALDWLFLEDSVEHEMQKIDRDRARGDKKLAVTSIKKLTKSYHKLEDLWNEILEDDVITQEECIKLHDLIRSSRIYPYDFEECLNYIKESVLEDFKVDNTEANKLYEYVFEILNVTKDRITTKIEQEKQAVS